MKSVKKIDPIKRSEEENIVAKERTSIRHNCPQDFLMCENTVVSLSLTV